MNKRHKIYVSFLCVLFLMINLMLSYQAQALNITVTAKVVVPPCVVNNGNVISVDFGDAILIPQINGQNYRTTIPYTIQCDVSAPDALKLQIRGSGATFNSDALETSQSGLGIVFYQDGQPLALNDKLDVSYSALPTFEAAPVKEMGTKLLGGAFTAGATLAIYYN